MARARANGIELEYETAGDRNNPAMLLVMGLGGQLVLWPEKLLSGLAARGFFVICFDNRDVGLSTDFAAWGPADIPAAMRKVTKGEKIEAPYFLRDMAADAVGLLDALGIDKAHMVGESMGGMIVQTVAGLYPERCRSMVSIYSSSGRLDLPKGKPEALAMLASVPENDTREARVAHYMKFRRTIGSPGYPMPEAELRALAEKSIDRRYYPDGVGRQYLAVIASGDRVELLKTIKVPTLVMHGEDDPLLPVACGRDVASLVPGAEFWSRKGWGHDLPPQLLPALIDKIAAFCTGK